MLCGDAKVPVCMARYWWVLIIMVLAFVIVKVDVPDYINCLLRFIALIVLIVLIGSFCLHAVGVLR